MNLTNRQEIRNLVGKLDSAAKEIKAMLAPHIAELDYYRDRESNQDNQETLEVCRLELARYGLQLQQHLVPALDNLGEEMLVGAGTKAVHSVCSPGHMYEQGGTKLIRTIPAEFSLPPSFEHIGTKALSKVKEGVAVVVALFVALALRR